MSTQKNSNGAMRCLSVQQPFGWAICVGLKTVENRTRGTSARGLIAIHSGIKQQRVNDFVRQHRRLQTGLLTFGAIIGVAELVDVLDMDKSLEDNPSACGPVCWVLESARLLPTPIPTKGKLNLYSLTESESDRVRSQLPGLGRAEVSAAGREWVSVMDSEFNRCVGRAESYSQLNMLDDWIRQLDRAIEIDGTHPELFFNRALARLEAKGDVSKILSDCDQALKLDSDNPGSLMLRAEAYRFLGDEVRAAEDERMAVAIRPDIRKQWRQMGEDTDEDAELGAAADDGA